MNKEGIWDKTKKKGKKIFNKIEFGFLMALYYIVDWIGKGLGVIKRRIIRLMRSYGNLFARLSIQELTIVAVIPFTMWGITVTISLVLKLLWVMIIPTVIFLVFFLLLVAGILIAEKIR